MAISTISFTKTPQAGDDSYGWTEDQLIDSGLLSGQTIALNVMANDLGGNAKRLWSIDDGNGHTAQTDYDLLNSDMGGIWESAASNNLGVADKITISNGQILLDLGNSLQKLGAANVNALAEGDHIHDEFVYAIRLANGTLSQATVTVDIYGQNDAASIAGDTTGSLTEDTTMPVTGTLTVSDADHGQSHTVTATNANSDQGLGTYSVDGDGHWSYTVDNAAVQHLSATETATDSFTVTSLDGTASQLVTITIQGENDPASIAGDTIGSLTEDDTAPATGSLTVSDVDDGEAHSQPASGSTGLGNYSVDGDGNWSYAVNNAAVQHLNGSETATDSFTVTSLDGTASQPVTITIQGENDPASITGDTTGSLTEDDTIPVTGSLTVSDVDDGEAHSQPASGSTGLGNYSVDGDGNWSYAVNNAAVQHLNASETATDSFTVTSLDGTASQLVTVTIQGENDPPVVSGAVTGSATENGSPSTLFALANASDVDDNTTLSVADVPLSLPDGVSYDGNTQSFTLDPSNTAFQHLAQGQQTAVTVNYGVSDGIATTPASVSWTVTGVNDPPALSASAANGSVGEGGSLALNISATDPDDGDLLSFTVSGVVNGATLDAGTDLGNGVWSLTQAQASGVNLLAGEDGPLDLVVTVSDQSHASDTQHISVTVNPVAEPPTLTLDGTTIVPGSSSQTMLNTVERDGTVGVPTPIEIANASDPDNDGTVSFTISGIPSFATLSNSAHDTLTPSSGNLTLNASQIDGLAITSSQAESNVTLTVDAHNSEGGDTVGYIHWPVISPDLGGPTDIGFQMNPQAGNSLAALGTFFEIGDPDAGDTFTYSVGAGSSSGFVLTPTAGGTSLDATGAAASTEDLLNIVATDAAGNSKAVAFHVWIGGNGGDTHTAMFSTNNIDDGVAGADTLTGSNGTDYIFGGANDDVLQGNGGADFLVGGNGNDSFRYAAVADSTAAAHDTILDFTPGADKIDLSGIDANATLPLAQTFIFDPAQNSAAVAGHVTWFQDTAHNETLVHAGVVGDGTLEIHLSGLLTLGSGNFKLS